MRALVFTTFLASLPFICPAGAAPFAPQGGGETSQQQEQKATPVSDQEQKKPQTAPAAPVSISPLIPVAAAADGTTSPKVDIAPGSPGAAVMAAGKVGGKPQPAPSNTRTYIIGAEDMIAVSVFENPGFSVQPQGGPPGRQNHHAAIGRNCGRYQKSRRIGR